MNFTSREGGYFYPLNRWVVKVIVVVVVVVEE